MLWAADSPIQLLLLIHSLQSRPDWDCWGDSLYEEVRCFYPQPAEGGSARLGLDQINSREASGTSAQTFAVSKLRCLKKTVSSLPVPLQVTGDDVAALLRRLPDAASLAQLAEQQEEAQDRQRQRQRPFQRRRKVKRGLVSEQQLPEERDTESGCSSQEGAPQAAAALLAGCSVAVVSLPAVPAEQAVSSPAQLTGGPCRVEIVCVRCAPWL